MARAKRHEEQENHERWLVSYADFITLLFAFFVVMYSTSSINEGKMRVLSDSLVASFAGRNKALDPIQVGKLMRSPYVDEISPITSPTQFVIVAPPEPRQALNEAGEDALEVNDGYLGGDLHAAVGADTGGDSAPVGPGEPDFAGGGEADEGAAAPPPEVADLSSVVEAVRASLAPLMDLSEVVLEQRPDWIEIQLDSARLFVSGSARLSRQAIPVLSQLAEILKSFPNPVQVEGFTDNIPIRTLSYPSNWELSAARAASVVHLFTQRGVPPERMVAVGYGEHRPIADNATAAGRAKNRRVVIVIPADEKVRRLLDADRTMSMQTQ